jgi:sigma-E factor negative regulatory protein RseA
MVKQMTDRIREQLSAFLDGELPEAETTLLLKRLERDEDLKGTLSRYSLIGAVMRTDGDMPAAHHVAARVRAAIADEPSFGPRRAPPWLRPAAGLAVAASVALATVLLLPRWMPGGPGTAPDTLVAAAPSTVATTAQPEAGVVPVVVAADDEPVATYTTPPLAADTAVALPSAQLASYLVAHSEYTLPLTRRSVVATVPRQDIQDAPADEKDEKKDDKEAR